MAGSGREACRMSGSSRETLLDVRQWSGIPHGCPGGPLGCLGALGRPSWMSGRPSRMSGSSRETFQDVREWVKRPSRMSGSGQEALSNVW